MKKKFVILFIFITILILGFLLSGPFLTLHSIKNSLDKKDSYKLSSNINFPILKLNIKGQLNDELSKKIKLESGIFNILAEGLATSLIDEAVESLLTTENIGRLINGEEPSSVLKNEKIEDSEDDSFNILESIEYKYVSHKLFSVLITGKNNKEINLILGRQGFKWKLINITIPEENQ